MHTTHQHPQAMRTRVRAMMREDPKRDEEVASCLRGQGDPSDTVANVGDWEGEFSFFTPVLGRHQFGVSPHASKS